MLQTNARVCSYSAGTDTNPIYMFSTTDSTNPPQPWPSIELGKFIFFYIYTRLVYPLFNLH